jgi:hypothetical protein
VLAILDRGEAARRADGCALWRSGATRWGPRPGGRDARAFTWRGCAAARGVEGELDDDDPGALDLAGCASSTTKAGRRTCGPANLRAGVGDADGIGDAGGPRPGRRARARGRRGPGGGALSPGGAVAREGAQLRPLREPKKGRSGRSRTCNNRKGSRRTICTNLKGARRWEADNGRACNLGRRRARGPRLTRSHAAPVLAFVYQRC